MSIGGGGASFWSMLKSSILFAGFERKASIPAFKHSCFVDSWQSALKAMTYRTGGMSTSTTKTSQAYLVVKHRIRVLLRALVFA